MTTMIGSSAVDLLPILTDNGYVPQTAPINDLSSMIV
jgi:hypothetical protein